VHNDALQQLIDRTEASDTIYRYCSSVDRGEWAVFRTVFTDDARVRFGNGGWLEGADTVAKMLETALADTVWRHHLVSVYHLDFDGDEATALTYQTSHLLFDSEADVVRVTVGRYHDRLRRTPDGWKISTRVMEVLWAGERRDPNGRLDAMGGRGPAQISL
jgi:hypothetical protein